MSQKSATDNLLRWVQLSTAVVIIVLLFLLYRTYSLAQPRSSALDQLNSQNEGDTERGVQSGKNPGEQQLSNFPKAAVLYLECSLADGSTHSMPGFIVRFHNHRQFLLTLADFLSQEQWGICQEVLCRRLDQSSFKTQGKPAWIGQFTSDKQPNILTKPDLSENLVCWEITDPTHPNAIPLAPDVLREKSPVWVLSLPATGSCRWLKAQVVEASENLVFVQVQERFDGDKLVGTIVVNPAGELVMLSMGGDFLLTGASSVGISKKLQQSILTR